MKSSEIVNGLLTFLQTSWWFRRFVSDCSSVATPPSMLTSKNIDWGCGQEQVEAFDQFKDLLTISPILQQVISWVLMPVLMRWRQSYSRERAATNGPSNTRADFWSHPRKVIVPSSARSSQSFGLWRTFAATLDEQALLLFLFTNR